MKRELNGEPEEWLGYAKGVYALNNLQHKKNTWDHSCPEVTEVWVSDRNISAECTTNAGQ